MDYRSLVNKLEAIQAGTYIKEATAPLSFTPTHFHKGNLGNKLPVMMTEPGVFWWEGGNQGGEMGGSGSRIVPWQGDAENRSGWNPASIDGEIKDGKFIDYPEGTTWKTAKAASDSDAALMAKLKQLVELVGKYVALKAKRGQGGKPAGPTTQDMGDGSKLTVDAKTGQTAATNDDGTPYIPGSNPNLPKNKVKESVEFKGTIARSLVESFGYQLDELTNTMDPSNPNAAFRDMPGASQVTKDLGGGNTLGSVGRERAQRAADQALQRGRTASADALNAFKPGAAAPAANVAASTGAKAASVGSKALSAGSKVLGKAMPLAGAYLGATSAIDSYKKGDYLGAALNGLSGAFSLVPGLGWIPAVGLGAWQAGRELSGATDKYDQAGAPAGQGGTPAGGAPSADVKALQQRILAKDPKALPQHGADGRMGPETQAAMKRLNIKENMMPQKSLAETMRDLQQRLTMLESDPIPDAPEVIQPTPDELATAETAKQLGAEIGKVGDEVVIIAKDKTIIDPETKEILVNNGGQLAGTGKTYEPAMAEGYDELDEGIWDSLLKGAARLGRTGAVNARRFARTNPVKTGLGIGAAGLAGGYASGAAGGTPTPATTTPPVRPPSTGGQGGTPTTPDTSADDAELAALKAQIDALIKELSTSKNPEIQKGLADIQTKLQ